MINARNQDLFRASLSEVGLKALEKQLDSVLVGTPISAPISVQIDLTLRCTAKCMHCHQWAWPSHDDFSFITLEKTLKKLRSWGVRTIIYSGGNPLLHADIIDILKLTRKLEFEIGIITEGNQLTFKLAKAIATNVSWIRYSLDGPNSLVHDKIRNRTGLFSDVVNSIYLIRSTEEAIDIGVNFVVQRDNVDCLDNMLSFKDMHPIDTLLFKLPHGNDPLKKYTLTKTEFSMFKRWVSKVLENGKHEKTNLPLLSALIKDYYDEDAIIDGAPTRELYSNAKCFAPLFSIVIDSHGEVYPCCYLHADNRHWKKSNQVRSEYVVGNILDDDILNKLDSKYRSKVLELPSKGKGECDSCTRFCQLNSGLSEILDRVKTENVDLRKVLLEELGDSIAISNRPPFL